MYYPYFITYILIGVVIGSAVFYWALRNGQFKDQQRARYLPLEPESPSRAGRATKFGRLETYVLFTLAALGLAASATVLIFAIKAAG